MVGVSDHGSSSSCSSSSMWTVGLINSQFKYLTAESFGNKINANGVSLRKKQSWSVMPAPVIGSSPSSSASSCHVMLRSHLGRMLSVDQFGNVTCDTELQDVPSDGGGCVFQVHVSEDGSGRWSLFNTQRRYYLSADNDKLLCHAKHAQQDCDLWYVHLCARPQTNIYSIGRKRFARVTGGLDCDPDQDAQPDTDTGGGALDSDEVSVCVDAVVAWGADTLFTLDFIPDRRLYALHTCNDMYLHREGGLQSNLTEDCLFIVEYHSAHLALKSVVSSLYLAPIGPKALLRTRARTVSRDELFSLENSPPQCTLISALTERYVSVKQGVDVSANQEHCGSNERFLLEQDNSQPQCVDNGGSGSSSVLWLLRSTGDKYWSVESCGSAMTGVQAATSKREKGSRFQLQWHTDDGSVSLLLPATATSDGVPARRYLAAKKSGHLSVLMITDTDSTASHHVPTAARFYFHLINRPVLVLKCDQGFIGYKNIATSNATSAEDQFKLECNKAQYAMIHVQRALRGQVHFRGDNGCYWSYQQSSNSGSNSGCGVCCNGRVPLSLHVQLRDSGRLLVMDQDGRTLCALKNGGLVFRPAGDCEDSAILWQF